MRSQFRISLLVVAAATLVIMVLMSSSTRWEEKANAATSTKLKISQFRENGPKSTGIGGSQDEFIEIYNNTDSNFTVGTTDLSNQGGIGVFASAGNGVTDNVVTIVCQIPNGTVIPARGHVLCVNVNGYSLSTLGSTNSTTGGGSNPGPLAITGGGTASVGNFPIINGTPTQAGAFSCQQAGCVATGNGAANGVGTSVDIPNDAGLVLINVGDNTVGASANVPDNGSFGFGATGVSPLDIIVYDRVGFAPYGSGAPLQACQLVNTAACGAGGSARPSLADNYCEGGAAGCLRPVGDASTENHGSLVFYGDSGQYALIRRETVISSTGTNPQDTGVNVEDFLMVAPDPGINIAFNITNFPTGLTNGLTSVLGSAGPLNIQGGIDFPETVLASRLFDTGRAGNQLPNAERRYVIDNQTTPANAGNMATTQQYNNPIGSFILRFGFRSTATAGTAIDKFRVRIDELAVPCGAGTPATASATPGTAEARNLHQTAPSCQGLGTQRTAVLKVLNMPSELVARETNDANNPATGTVRGSVIEDAAGGNQTAYFGGGINNSVVRTGTAQGSLTGEYTTAIANSSIPTVESNNFYMAFRFGVVKGGSFRFVLQPEGTKGSTAAPTVTPVP
jgi:hypothetical protein